MINTINKIKEEILMYSAIPQDFFSDDSLIILAEIRLRYYSSTRFFVENYLFPMLRIKND